jgi:glycosyltransferase involved in cell wall biosynthesis
MEVLGGAAAWITRTPWVASERSAGAHYPRDLRHALRRLIGRHADAVVANSKGGLTFWSASRAVKYVIPNALALEQLDAVARENLDEAGDAKVILFAGRLETEKNLPNLIDALAIAMRDRNAIALLCGAGPGEADVRARILAHGLSDRIRLEGYTTRLWGLMKRADVFVSMSWFEGHPNAVLEAAACGCPLSLSDIGAHREIFGEESATFACPADVSSIAGVIARVLDDPDAARIRARRAKEIVSRFSIAAAADAYLRVYQSVLADEHAIEVGT